ncbi:MAG: hypothetical protein N2258_05670 [Brevinematales bacterium]|nr:hypothetical protein [Brevinematales bacterium]
MNENLLPMLKNLEWIYGIVRFLFFNIFGWIVIGLVLFFVVFVNSKSEKGYFSLGKFVANGIEKTFFLFSNIFQLVVGVLLISALISFIPVIKEAKEALTLYKDVKNLNSALKNLKSERKILEAFVDFTEDKDEIVVNLRYFAYSPVKNTDVMTGEAQYKIPGSRVYIDSIVINFDYSLVESGKAINLSLPYKIFSDKVSFNDGISINSIDNDIPLSLKLDRDDIFLLDKDEYDSTIKKLIQALVDKNKALKMGIRTFYSEAVMLYPTKNKKYSVYSTGNGGLVVR